MRRRTFLTSLGAGLTAAVPARLSGLTSAPAVAAVPTVFHRHPDGQTTLVRFIATGTGAQAGRLRVVDLRTGSLVGTAGMIQRGGDLVGELWLPLPDRRRVRSELETPSTRSVLRTVHELAPTPRWTITWITVASPDAVETMVADVPFFLRGVRAAELFHAGVRVNPWHALPRDADHVDLLRMTLRATEASRSSGVAVSAVAVHRGPAPDTVRRALAGAGVRALVEQDGAADLESLGLQAGRLQAAARIEAWLAEHVAAGADAGDIVTAVGADPRFAMRIREQVEEWNAAYAYPRFVVGDGAEALRTLARRRPASTSAPPPHALPPPPAPARRRSADEALLPLARAIAPGEPSLAGIAARFAFPVSGLLVFNPSPFSRSGPVDVPGGGLRIVTDVPGLGYAFVPDQDLPAAPAPVPDEVEIRTRQYRLRAERTGGGIASLVHVPTGTELVAPGGVLNGLAEAVLSGSHHETLPGVGERLVLRRVTTRGIVTSTITIYDTLPWVDIANHAEPSADGLTAWRFAFAAGADRARWEVPGGTAEAPLPTVAAPVRWTALQGDGRAVLLATESANVEADDQGRCFVHAGWTGRMRMQFVAGLLLADDPWQFGFGLPPLVARPAGGPGGTLSLPTFGSMLEVRDPTVAVLAVQPALDGVGTMVYLQDLGGPDREVHIRPDLLDFRSGVLTDLAERDGAMAAAAPNGGIAVPITTFGWAAVRLLGVGIRGIEG